MRWDMSGPEIPSARAIAADVVLRPASRLLTAAGCTIEYFTGLAVVGLDFVPFFGINRIHVVKPLYNLYHRKREIPRAFV